MIACHFDTLARAERPAFYSVGSVPPDLERPQSPGRTLNSTSCTLPQLQASMCMAHMHIDMHVRMCMSACASTRDREHLSSSRVSSSLVSLDRSSRHHTGLSLRLRLATLSVCGGADRTTPDKWASVSTCLKVVCRGGQTVVGDLFWMICSRIIDSSRSGNL